jgi:hypothetical protein
MGHLTIPEVTPPSVPSYLAGSMPDGLSKPETKRGQPKGSTTKTKSKRGASQSSSPKKPNSGTRSKKK